MGNGVGAFIEQCGLCQTRVQRKRLYFTNSNFAKILVCKIDEVSPFLWHDNAGHGQYRDPAFTSSYGHGALH